MKLETRNPKFETNHKNKGPVKIQARPEVGLWDKLVIAFGYVFFFPTLSIILSDRRKNPVLALHAAQGFVLWSFILAGIVSLRLCINQILLTADIPFIDKTVTVFFVLIWFYSIKCAFLFLMGKAVRIPVVSAISGWLA